VPQLGLGRSREGELRVLGGGVRPGGSADDRAGDGDDVDDVGGPAGLEAREEGAQAPDSAQVVDARDLFDPVRVGGKEVASR
jgi:hypothetical protein